MFVVPVPPDSADNHEFTVIPKESLKGSGSQSFINVITYRCYNIDKCI